MASDFKDLNLDKVRDAGFAACDKGRQVLLSYFGQQLHVKEKDMAGLVSEADVESEKAIVKELLVRFPKTEILGEESNFKEGTEIHRSLSDIGRWVIDPLDGTTNYIHRLPIYCISIGYEIAGEVVFGVIDVPSLDTRYHAIKGAGAFKNGIQIHVSNREKLEDSLLATGFFPPNKEALKEQLKIFGRLIDCVRGMRRLGAAAFDLCLVAEGVLDAFWEKNLKPWDTSAGSLLVREAGGFVTNYCGDEFHPYCDSIIAGSGKIHQQIVDIVDAEICKK